MREKYQKEKTKQGETNVAPSTLTPWYDIFDNIFGVIARITCVPNGVNQGVSAT
jgi:hypothetical protein